MLLQRLAHSFDLSEETTEFLVARWDKMNLEEVLATRGVDLSTPVEPEVSNANEIANQTNTEKLHLSREEMVFYVRDSWEFASRHREQVAKQMYARLLWTDESAAVLFIHTDMEHQSELLTHMLDVAVSKLDVLDEITDTVRELGRRHVSYSIRPEHYSTVGASLLWALEQTLGPQRWTDKVEAAWKLVYTILMSVMLEGDQEARNGL